MLRDRTRRRAPDRRGACRADAAHFPTLMTGGEVDMPEGVIVRSRPTPRLSRRRCEELEGLSRSFGAQLTSGLKSAIASGKELDDILRGDRPEPCRHGAGPGAEAARRIWPARFLHLLLGGLLPFANGGVPSATAPIMPFAGGGVVSAPTYFPMGSQDRPDGRGRRRGDPAAAAPADGRLGVAASGGGGSPVNVVFNVTHAGRRPHSANPRRR